MVSVLNNNDTVSYTEITEVTLSAFVYRLFHEDFSSINGTFPVHKALH